MSVHIEARPGDIAPIVLLPGDPLRAQFIAERFLQDATCHSRIRNALGFTGTYKGTRVSVQSTGMGMPSAAIYIHELLTTYGCRTLIRIGTCGAIRADLRTRDLVLAQAAADSSMFRAFRRRDVRRPPASICCDARRLSTSGQADARRHRADDTFYPDDSVVKTW
jgi:purine-nucleoside phosphorylase